MKTKLTLTIEKSIIEKAKLLANQSGKSLSEMVEKHLKKEIQKIEETGDFQVPAEFEGLFGSVKLPENLDEKKEIRDLFSKKYSE